MLCLFKTLIFFKLCKILFRFIQHLKVTYMKINQIFYRINNLSLSGIKLWLGGSVHLVVDTLFTLWRKWVLLTWMSSYQVQWKVAIVASSDMSPVCEIPLRCSHFYALIMVRYWIFNNRKQIKCNVVCCQCCIICVLCVASRPQSLLLM